MKKIKAKVKKVTIQDIMNFAARPNNENVKATLDAAAKSFAEEAGSSEFITALYEYEEAETQEEKATIFAKYFFKESK